MPQPLVLLAHAPSAEPRAAEIAAQLAALGYAVDALPEAPRARNARLNAAHRLIILWSRDAVKSPALHATARLARASGKLTCVRLDAARPPAGLCSKISIRLPRGRARSRAWRRILDDTSRTRTQSAAMRRSRSTRTAGLGAALVLALVVGASLYVVDAGFAARVDAWTREAHAIVDTITAHAMRDG